MNDNIEIHEYIDNVDVSYVDIDSKYLTHAYIFKQKMHTLGTQP
jgi:hypothetical protein